VLVPVSDARCWGLRGVRISPIAWRWADAGVEKAGVTAGAEKAPKLVGASSWFNGLGGVAIDAARGGACCPELVATSDSEML
jgi:hypothetical protein